MNSRLYHPVPTQVSLCYAEGGITPVRRLYRSKHATAPRGNLALRSRAKTKNASKPISQTTAPDVATESRMGTMVGNAHAVQTSAETYSTCDVCRLAMSPSLPV